MVAIDGEVEAIGKIKGARVSTKSVDIFKHYLDSLEVLPLCS